MSTLFGKSKRKRVRSSVEQKVASETLHDTLHDKDHEEPSVEAAAVSDLTLATESFNKQDTPDLPLSATFQDLGLSEPLVATCRQLGFKRPTPVQRKLIPFLLQNTSTHCLALASTGSGKTAAFCLPIIQHLQADPYGIFAIILTPTRELAKQIHQQVLALGSAYNVQSALVVGGLNSVQQALALDKRPHVCVATPGRLGQLLRGPRPAALSQVRYLVMDEADRLLTPSSGFTRDVAEVLLHCGPQKNGNKNTCQTLLFSATMTRSLDELEGLAGAGQGRLPLKKFVIDIVQAEISKNDEDTDENAKKKAKTSESRSDDNESSGVTVPKIPEGLKQEYIFMPSRVRDAYLVTVIRTLMINGGKVDNADENKRGDRGRKSYTPAADTTEEQNAKATARSCIIFVSTCERTALVSGILTQLDISNVALHSLLTQNRRLASLAKFKSQQVRVLVATDVASRGLDIPTVDLVINSELPRQSVAYVHRVGRTARAGRRGRAISLVAESDVALVHAAERVSGRSLEACTDVNDEMALPMLGPVAKAARLAKMHLQDIDFDELLVKFKERKVRDKQERRRLEAALKATEGKTK